MIGISDCILWLDKSRAWGLVDFSKVRAISGPHNPVRIEARSLVAEGAGPDGAFRHPSWVKGACIQSRWWTAGLLLAKTLGGNTQAPQEYWSDCRGYLFLVVRDGRNHELAVAIAPMAESPPVTEGA